MPRPKMSSSSGVSQRSTASLIDEPSGRPKGSRTVPVPNVVSPIS